MKIKLLTFILFILGMISCKDKEQFTVDCLPSNLQNGVIAFYPFNNGSLNDESPNNNNFTNPTSAIPSDDRNGNANCAFIFDNSQQDEEYLTTTNAAFLNELDQFSISLWYQPLDATIYGSTIEGLFSRGNETRCPNRMGEWSMGIYDCRRAVFGHDNSVWAFDVTDFSGGCQGEVEALVDQWHHVVGVKDGDNYKLFFNGLVNEVANGDGNCGSSFQPAQDVGDVFIGFGFTGKIDDIIIYNRVLTESEITELNELNSCCR